MGIHKRYIFSSLTRIAHLEYRSFDIQQMPKELWDSGDYVAGEVIRPSRDAKIELVNGRMMDGMIRDVVIGALGIRHATLEITGDWQSIGADGEMHMLTGAGLFGKKTSGSVFTAQPIHLRYLGHVSEAGNKLTMQQFVPEIEEKFFHTPSVLIVGTSMSAGKTTTARIVTHQLKLAGMRVLGAKLAGAGRYRDILNVKDAGADEVMDFVDVGLPSTICDRNLYLDALTKLLSKMAVVEADFAVLEVGASPLEPYNGDVAIEKIRDNVKCTILCASDPYAVYGVMRSFHLRPSIVAGPATNTIGGMELVRNLCGVKPLNLLDPESIPELKEILGQKLGVVL